LGAWPVPWFLCGSLGVWPVPWAPCGHRRSMANPLGPMLPPWGRGLSHGFHVAAVGEWPVRWLPCGRRGGVAGPLSPCGSRWGVTGFLGLCGRLGGVAGSAGSRVAAVGAWPVPWTPSSCRGSVVGPQTIVWLPWGRGQSLGPCVVAVGRGQFPGPCVVAV